MQEVEGMMTMIERTTNIGGIEIGYEGEVLSCLGLGSCVGVVVYDPVKKIAGMAHVMLPDSSEDQRRAMYKNRCIIADSDNYRREALKKILTSNDLIVVREAKDYEETITSYIMLKSDVSFIIVDVDLPPGGKGVEAVEHLSEVDKNLNAILLTHAVGKDVIGKYMASGAQEIILNPFTEQKVMTSVDYIMYKDKMRFADRAIPMLIERIINRGAEKKNIIAKIAGGAHMFTTIKDRSIMDIGNRNIEAVREILDNYGIEIKAEDVGANIGRTVMFDISSGKFEVKTKDGIRQI